MRTADDLPRSLKAASAFLCMSLLAVSCDGGRSSSGVESGVADGAQSGEEITLASGVVIEDLIVGVGNEATKGSTVTTHVLGTFTNGEKFWSNLDDPRTAEGYTAVLRGGRGGVIEGWVEGVPGMREGGKRRIQIPWKLAYGERGNPPLIPAKADMIFEIEILKVH